jgi:ubiquinone/menaquinone biosynthesis C-methylase UbiE
MLQCDPWADASRSRMSERWAHAAAGWNRALTDALISAAAIKPESLVIDLAAGSGDPALDIIQRTASARVIALDRSSAGLALARQRSEELRAASQIAFVSGDVHALPVASECADRITCRFGVMFFTEVAQAISEMLRVLKPGGRVALLAWGSFEQPFFAATIGVVLRIVPGAEVPRAARAMHRFAIHGSLGTEMRKGGFSKVQETERTLPRIWAGSTQQLWEYQQEVSTLHRPMFDVIPAALRPLVDSEVIASLAQFRDSDRLSVPVRVILATGEKIDRESGVRCLKNV